MATITGTLDAERWVDEVLIRGAHGAIAGAPISEFIRLPAGIGDVAVMSVIVRGSGVDVAPLAATVARGVCIRIFSADAAKVIDLVGTSEWFYSFDGANVLEYTAYVDPDALVLWRQDELMSILSPELDSDATPLGSVTTYIKAVHVRPTETIGKPLQLVR